MKAIIICDDYDLLIEKLGQIAVSGMNIKLIYDVFSDDFFEDVFNYINEGSEANVISNLDLAAVILTYRKRGGDPSDLKAFADHCFAYYNSNIQEHQMSTECFKIVGEGALALLDGKHIVFHQVEESQGSDHDIDNPLLNDVELLKNLAKAANVGVEWINDVIITNNITYVHQLYNWCHKNNNVSRAYDNIYFELGKLMEEYYSAVISKELLLYAGITFNDAEDLLNYCVSQGFTRLSDILTDDREDFVEERNKLENRYPYKK